MQRLSGPVQRKQILGFARCAVAALARGLERGAGLAMVERAFAGVAMGARAALSAHLSLHGHGQGAGGSEDSGHCDVSFG